MKFNKLFIGMLGALSLSACSSDNGVPEENGKPSFEGESRYMSVTIRNAYPETRAGGDQTTTDDGDHFEEGYIPENDVKSLRFYFFKADGTPASVQYMGQNFYDCQNDDISLNETSGMPNVEKTLNAMIIINVNDENASASDINKVVAVANFKNIEDQLGNGSLSLEQLSALLVEPAGCSSEEKGFLMTNSSFLNPDYVCATDIEAGAIKTNAEEARENPIDIYIERLVAKVRVSTAWNEEMETPVEAVLNGNTVSAVPLQSKENGVKKAISVDGKRVYIVFNTWDLWWTADKSYLLKKVDKWDSSSAGLEWAWNNALFKRSYWAQNPEGLTLSKFHHSDASKLIGKATSQNYREYSAYCLENAADHANNGFKKAYNPDTETSNRTLVYLNATLVTLDENNVASPLTLVEWSSRKYDTQSALAAMFAPVQNIIYFQAADDPNSFIPVTVADLQFASAIDAGMADHNSENSKRYLSYLNLKKEGLFGNKTVNGADVAVVDGKLFQKDANGAFVEYADLNAANDVLESVGGAKIWNNGSTYYYHEITHLGTTGKEANGRKFAYGVVRNHIYDVVINSVFGLGTPVLNPTTELITPQKPTPDTYFLGARVNILSWRIVNNDVTLEW